MLSEKVFSVRIIKENVLIMRVTAMEVSTTPALLKTMVHGLWYSPREKNRDKLAKGVVRYLLYPR